MPFIYFLTFAPFDNVLSHLDDFFLFETRAGHHRTKGSSVLLLIRY